MSVKPLSAEELQSLRDLGNESERAADEIVWLHGKLNSNERVLADFAKRLHDMDVGGDKWITVVGCLSLMVNCQIRELRAREGGE